MGEGAAFRGVLGDGPVKGMGSIVGCFGMLDLEIQKIHPDNHRSCPLFYFPI